MSHKHKTKIITVPLHDGEEEMCGLCKSQEACQRAYILDLTSLSASAEYCALCGSCVPFAFKREIREYIKTGGARSKRLASAIFGITSERAMA